MATETTKTTGRLDIVTPADAMAAVGDLTGSLPADPFRDAALQRVYSIGCYADALFRLLNLYEELDHAVRSADGEDALWHLSRIDELREGLRIEHILEHLPRTLADLKAQIERQKR